MRRMKMMMMNLIQYKKRQIKPGGEGRGEGNFGNLSLPCVSFV